MENLRFGELQRPPNLRLQSTVTQRRPTSMGSHIQFRVFHAVSPTAPCHSKSWQLQYQSRRATNKWWPFCDTVIAGLTSPQVILSRVSCSVDLAAVTQEEGGAWDSKTAHLDTWLVTSHPSLKNLRSTTGNKPLSAVSSSRGKLASHWSPNSCSTESSFEMLAEHGLVINQ